MMNLLPQADKNTVRLEYWWRLGEVSCAATIALFVLGSVLLVPSFAYVTFETYSLEASLVSLREERAVLEKDTETQTIVKDVQDKIRVLRGDEDPSEFFPVFEAVLGRRTEGVSFTSFSFERSSSYPKGRIALQGIAKSRGDLLALVASLEAEERLSKVESPIENLVKNKDIPFTLYVYVK